MEVYSSNWNDAFAKYYWSIVGSEKIVNIPVEQIANTNLSVEKCCEFIANITNSTYIGSLALDSP